MLGYHVTQDWEEGKDLLPFSKMHQWNEATIRTLLKRASDMWHETWTVDKAHDYYTHHGEQIHFHETEEEARKFAGDHGGYVLEVVLDGIEICRNEESLYTCATIPARQVRRIS